MFTGFYAGILGLWLAWLYLTVVKYRREYHVGLGDGDKEDLLRAIRIHGNFIETVPFVLLIMLLLEGIYSWPIVIHIFGALLIFSRVLHYLGLSKTSGYSRERFAAGILTMALVIVGSLMLLYGTLIYGNVLSL